MIDDRSHFDLFICRRQFLAQLHDASRQWRSWDGKPEINKKKKASPQIHWDLNYTTNTTQAGKLYKVRGRMPIRIAVWKKLHFVVHSGRPRLWPKMSSGLNCTPIASRPNCSWINHVQRASRMNPYFRMWTRWVSAYEIYDFQISMLRHKVTIDGRS